MGLLQPPPAPAPRAKRHWGAVKQVTRRNFAEALQQIKDHLVHADFVAVSTQKTGSAFPSSSSSSSLQFYAPALPSWWHRVSHIDTPETAYLKAKLAAERFELFQFAVCPFRLRGSKVVAHPYNFHLFPRDELNASMPSYSFSCQTSFITSMAREGFDFNVCIYDGISYLSRVQESMTKDRDSLSTVGPIRSSLGSSVADAIFMERIKSRIQQWRNACGSSTVTRDDALVRSLRKLMLGGDVYGSRPCMNIEVCNNRQVLLVMQVLRQAFDNLVPLIISDKGGEYKEVRVVLTSSEDDKNILLTEIQSMEEENDRKIRGFREVIDMLSNSHKPIITYNALDDFTFIHSKFIAPLPPSMAEFMCSLRLVFSNIVDINYLFKEIGPLRKANNIPAAMSYLRRQFFAPIDTEIPDEADKNLGKNHGHSVLRITNVFAKLSLILKIDHTNCQSTSEVSTTSVENYANVFHPCCSVFRENEEDEMVVWMNDVRKVSSSSLVFIWGFGHMVSFGELKHRLYGTHYAFLEDFDIRLVDESCAVVVFWKPNSAHTLLQDVRSGNIGFGALSDMISNGLRITGYEAYKRVCGMGLWEMG
uniref:Poly(A)-specific ribonuclease PARN-like n=1 Tax=Anthurium amnicola TaxID=1678845 RepID=A0A1D1XX06_9ARAE